MEMVQFVQKVFQLYSKTRQHVDAANTNVIDAFDLEMNFCKMQGQFGNDEITEKAFLAALCMHQKLANLREAMSKCGGMEDLTRLKNLPLELDLTGLCDRIIEIPNHWPHQSRAEAALTYIWFPKELDFGTDMRMYYHLAHVRFRLAHAARYNNPLTIVLLEKAWNTIKNPSEERDMAQLSRFGIEWRNEQLKLCSKEEGEFPYYQMGSLCLHQFTQDEARKWFEIGATHDAKCHLLFAELQHNDLSLKKKHFAELALSPNVQIAAKAKVGLGKSYTAESRKKAFDYFYQAAESNESEGWFRCACMIEKGFQVNPIDASLLYFSATEKYQLSVAKLHEKAADCGMIYSYVVAANHSKDVNEKKRLHRKGIAHGCLFSHVYLGNILAEEGNTQEAMQQYELAGVHGIPEFWRLETQENKKDIDNIVAKLEANAVQEICELKKIAGIAM